MVSYKLVAGLASVLILSASMVGASAEKNEKSQKVKEFTQMVKEFTGNKILHQRVRPLHFQEKIDFKNIVSTENAMASAEKYAKGKATSVRLMSHGVPSYLVKVATSNGLKTVKVAADTGKVIPAKKDKNAGLYNALRGKGDNKLKLDLTQAMKQAQKEVKGRVMSAELITEPGNMAYRITIDTDKDGPKNVMISGSTGKTLAIRDHGGNMNFVFKMGDAMPHHNSLSWDSGWKGKVLHFGGGKSFVFACGDNDSSEISQKVMELKEGHKSIGAHVKVIKDCE